jgi:Metal-dependent hydrolases of the beta-lactamase superfamily II
MIDVMNASGSKIHLKCLWKRETIIMVNKLFFLPAGTCFLDQSAVNQNLPSGKLTEMPVWCFLLETSDGPILVDTGMPDSFVNNPDYYKGTRREGRLVPNMKEEDRITNILKRIGYQPSDIQAVISSHLHLDHAGGNGHFRESPIVLQKAEYDAAIKDEDYSPKECRIPDLRYQLIEGDYELAPALAYLLGGAFGPALVGRFLDLKVSFGAIYLIFATIAALTLVLALLLWKMRSEQNGAVE